MYPFFEIVSRNDNKYEHAIFFYIMGARFCDHITRFTLGDGFAIVQAVIVHDAVGISLR